MKPVIINGEAAPGFEDLHAEFARNFTERGEIGAACAIYYRGEKVVDLWGGESQPNHAWQHDTMTLIFSATKGIAAVVLAKLHSQGHLDYQEKISHYWPEFAQNGKEEITVRQLLCQQAGLVLLDQKLSVAQLADLDQVARIIATAKPQWQPGMYHGYQAGTIGFFMGELVRRTDPRGRSLGQFFQEEIAEPLGLDFYIGLPKTLSASSISWTQMINPFLALFNLGKMPPGLRKVSLNPFSLFMKSVMVVKDYNPNSRETWSVEQPSGNGIGTARSAAFLYSLLAQGGSRLGLKAETFALLNARPEVPPGGGWDQVMNIESRYGLGFMKPDPTFNFSPNPLAFGFLGATGSFAFADPQKEIGYAYFTSKMGYYGVNDPREQSLRQAMYKAVAKLEK